MQKKTEESIDNLPVRYVYKYELKVERSYISKKSN